MLADLEANQGNYDRAIALNEEGVRLRQEAMLEPAAASVSVGVAEYLLRRDDAERGDRRRAAQILAEARALREREVPPNHRALAHLGQLEGELSIREGNPAGALRPLHASLAGFHEQRDTLGVMQTLLALAAAHSTRPDPCRAVRLLAARARITQEIGYCHGRWSDARSRSLAEALRAALPRHRFAACWTEGEQFPWEQILADELAA
jgi:hypothetical protein